MFIFIGCSIMLIFLERNVWMGHRHARQLQMLRCCIEPGKATSLIQFLQFISTFLDTFCWYCDGKQLGNNLVICNYCQCVIPVIMNLKDALFLEMYCECLLKGKHESRLGNQSRQISYWKRLSHLTQPKRKTEKFGGRECIKRKHKVWE